jgi:hypothetical protein
MTESLVIAAFRYLAALARPQREMVVPIMTKRATRSSAMRWIWLRHRCSWLAILVPTEAAFDAVLPPNQTSVPL